MKLKKIRANSGGNPRIYADFNGLRKPDFTEGRLAVALDTLGTLRDLTNAGLRLAEGLRLTVYDWSDEEEDLEAEATARYDPDAGLWWAELGPEGYEYVPKRVRVANPRFLCLGCRYDLASDPTAWGEWAPGRTHAPAAAQPWRRPSPRPRPNVNMDCRPRSRPCNPLFKEPGPGDGRL